MKTLLGILLGALVLAAGLAIYPEWVDITDQWYTIAQDIEPSMSSIEHAWFSAAPLILLALIIYAAYAFYKMGKRR